MMDLRQSRNLLVQQMTAADRERLGRYFTPQRLDYRETLFEQDAAVEQVHFVESGMVSLVTDLEHGETIETGTVGNEGLAGLPAVLGVRHAPGRAFCQIPGSSIRVASAVIAAEADAGTPWFRLLLRYANFVTAMTAQHAACNRIHPVEARASRWLLMTHDRVEGDAFPLTQEFLAQMLGVARPTVNIVGATLQRAGFIHYTRGTITVLDRAALERTSCECYARVRLELDRMLDGDSIGQARAARGRRQRVSGWPVSGA